MPILRYSLLAITCLYLLCGPSPQLSGHIRPVESFWVYNITEHNDSLYFSTSEEGVFAFHRDNPKAIRRVGRSYHYPFRSVVFTKNKKSIPSQSPLVNAGKSEMYTASYHAGVYVGKQDTLLPVPWAPIPAWYMKLDTLDNIWLATSRGVYRQEGDSLIRFCGMRESHDMAAWHDGVAVAHAKGTTLYSDSGAIVKDLVSGMVCWNVTAYDSVLLAGGVGRCVVFRGDSSRAIRFPLSSTILWSVAVDAQDTVFFGTQSGLYKAALTDSVAIPAGFTGMCVKSLFVDSKDILWVGRFYGPKKKKWFFF